jgi:pimeloyl-ACP methyl ester carboxylesterase
MRRTLLLAVLALLAVGPAPASAAFGRCSPQIVAGATCARVSVPLDHSGATAGRISIRVTRLRATRPARRALVYLSGGPGGAGIEEFAFSLDPVLRLRSRYHLIGFDQRGTGRSGLLVCPSMQRDGRLRSTRAAEACAQRLGERRRHYTTAQTVEDLEAIRRELGVERLMLFGVSYGTKLALAYARAYPTRVERMILDSVVDPDDADPWGLENYAAIGPSLRGLCPRSCRGITSSPVADLAALNARLARSPMRGIAYDARGRAHRRALTGLKISDLLFDADYAPALRAAVPAAVQAALRNRDPVPLLRLMELARPLGVPSPARLFSAGRYAAVCEETPLPWARATPVGIDRLREALARAAELPAGAFAPFDFDTIRADEIDLCLRWPLSEPAPVLAGTGYPDVPVLVLQGGEDLRTPPSTSARIARMFPRSARVLVPGVGHAVLGSDLSGCADRRLASWLRGEHVAPRCSRVSTGLPPLSVPPSSFSALRPSGGLRGSLGRTVAAIDATLDDVVVALSLGLEYADRGSGLRGGTFRAVSRGMVLRRLRVVPGVVVSGAPAAGGALRLQVSGARALDGMVVLSASGRLTGRLGGRRVSARMRGGGPPEAVAFGARARTSPAPSAARP